MWIMAACSGAAAAQTPVDFSGTWAMVQHSRPGGAFYIPVEPELSAEGKAVTEAFAAQYDVKTYEANEHCVEPGMPTLMWGIGGAMMEIVQQPQRITLLSELVNQSRRIYLDGRDYPDGFPFQRVGYSIGQWEGETLVIETKLMTEWHAPRWPHSDQLSIVERWSLVDPEDIEIVGLRSDRPPPAIAGKVLVNEMQMTDPVFYGAEPEAITVVYRRLEDDAVFEDNCPEGIWMEKLRELAKAP